MCSLYKIKLYSLYFCLLILIQIKNEDHILFPILMSGAVNLYDIELELATEIFSLIKDGEVANVNVSILKFVK